MFEVNNTLDLAQGHFSLSSNKQLVEGREKSNKPKYNIWHWNLFSVIRSTKLLLYSIEHDFDKWRLKSFHLKIVTFNGSWE